jgi:hypothetical protein
MAISVTTASGAWIVRPAQDGNQQVVGQIEFVEADLIVRQLRGFDLIELPEGGLSGDAGAPWLACMQFRIALPEGFAARQVSLVSRASVRLPGTFELCPAQRPLPVSTRDAEAHWVDPDPDAYAAGNVYPGEPVRLLGMTDLAGQGMAVVEICPLTYDPSEGAVILHTRLELVVTCAPGYTCGDAPPLHLSAERRGQIESQLREWVVNPEHARIGALGLQPPHGVGLPAGDYDYVIVTPQSWVPSFEVLADWKTRKGVPATVVTTEWIYNEGGYTGSDDSKIRSFVADAYGTWGTTYILIGGDSGYVPYNEASTPIEPYMIPNDSYYSDFDGDWTAEVNVGRASVFGETGIATFINKILTYEQDPPLSSYGHKVLMLGFDLDNWTHGESCKDQIYSTYFPSGWSITRVYDSYGGNHLDDAINAINAGHNLINHIDHCYYQSMGMGSHHHDWSIYTGHASSFSNADRQSILYTLGCWPNAFDYNQCIGEAWVRNPGGGAIVFAGNTRYGWFYSGNTSAYSFRYDRYFWRSLVDQEHYVVGEAFSDHKNDYYPGDNHYKYIWTELNLLGDPQLCVWMDDPQAMVTSYADVIETGCEEFTVHVEDGGGAPQSGALVCIWMGEEVYERQTTNASGNATFSPEPASEGEMLVTVTKRDFVPHLGSVTVEEAFSGMEDADPRVAFNLSAVRSPQTGPVHIEFSLGHAARVNLSVIDLTGRVLRQVIENREMTAGTHNAVWDGRDAAGRPVAAGVYLYRLNAGPHEQVRRLLLMR